MIRDDINNSTTKSELVALGVKEFSVSKSSAERLSVKNLRAWLLQLLDNQETLAIISTMAKTAAEERKN